MPEFTNPATAEKWAQITYGCSRAEAVRLNDGAPLNKPDSKAKRYTQHKYAATVRGVAWEIDFPAWVGVWNRSGKWAERGTGKHGYCMSRRGDVGPYSEANVFIQLVPANSREWQLRRLNKAA